MDLEAFAAENAPAWQRLDELVRRRTRSGPECDELVGLYQRAGAQLSQVQAVAPLSPLAGRLGSLVARARGSITAPPERGWRDVVHYLAAGFPAAVYRARWWWTGVAVAFLAVSTLTAWWVATEPAVQAAIAAPDEVRQLVEEDFENYYSENPAGSFAAKVATNNAWVAAGCLVLGVAIVPVLYLLLQNALNVAVSAGLMAAAGRLDVFFGLILPHGLLELTAVFVAAGAGLRLGWAWIDPGPRTRSQALAEEGRATVGLAPGLALVLVASGVVEAFVTPSGLPTWARVAVGATVASAFLAWVFVVGRRAARAGETGDLPAGLREDTVPVSG